jgi:hypothetical protein
MKSERFLSIINATAVAVALAWVAALVPRAEGAAKNAPGPAAPDTKTNQPVVVAIPQSVFVVPASPKQGRNPFFPNSVFGGEVSPQPQPTRVDLSSFVLNGITSPPKRTVIINGRTFEKGEVGEVRLPGGARELIKCEDIGDDFAVIIVKGQRRELRFRGL